MNNYYVLNNNDHQNHLALQSAQLSKSLTHRIDLETIEFKDQVIAAHERYLQLDDDDQRDEYLEKLHKRVVNYLLKVPHSCKFLLPEFNRLIENCVQKNSFFDPLKAAESFDVMFKIVNNLILKPWRKEFHQISIHNCNFVHLISRQIPNYDHLLKLMGYEARSKNGLIGYYLATKRNINEELLKLISFDCYVAFVEFRYIYQFGEILRSENIKPNNWQYIYKLRKRFTGDFESTLENYLLVYHDEIDEQQEKIDKKYKHLNNLIIQHEQQQQAHTQQKDQYDDLVQSKTTTNDNLINLDFDLSSSATNKKYDGLESLLLNSSSTSSPPTSFEICRQQNRTVNITPPKGFLNNSDDCYYAIKHKSKNGFHDSLNARKLSPQSRVAQRPSETDLDRVDFIDDAINEEESSDDSHHMNRIALEQELNSKIKYLDNNAYKLEQAMKSDSMQQNSNSSLVNGRMKSNSLEKKSSNKMSNKTSDKKYSTLDSKAEKKRLSKDWYCVFCTYLNDSRDNICKMCSKTKSANSSKSKTDSSELAILGRECNLCTLVNKPNEIVCRACGNSLKNSASYI